MIGACQGRRAAWRIRATCATALIVWCGAVSDTGCAARRHHSIADSFIRQGKPSIDLGGSIQSGDTGTYVSQLRKVAAEARPRGKAPANNTAEVQEQGLRDALAALHATPSAETQRRVAFEYRRLGVLDAAFRHFSAAIAMHAKDAVSHDQRARIWRIWGLPHLGLPDAKRAVQLAPTSATAWNTLGLLLEESQAHERAVNAYLRAVVLNDQATYAWQNLCRAWIDQRDAASAVQACRRASWQEPSHVATQARLHQAERMLAGIAPAPPLDTAVASSGARRQRAERP